MKLRVLRQGRKGQRAQVLESWVPPPLPAAWRARAVCSTQRQRLQAAGVGTSGGSGPLAHLSFQMAASPRPRQCHPEQPGGSPSGSSPSSRSCPSPA